MTTATTSEAGVCLISLSTAGRYPLLPAMPSDGFHPTTRIVAVVAKQQRHQSVSDNFQRNYLRRRSRRTHFQRIQDRRRAPNPQPRFALHCWPAKKEKPRCFFLQIEILFCEMAVCLLEEKEPTRTSRLNLVQ
jgi:hypothetical protein